MSTYRVCMPVYCPAGSFVLLSFETRMLIEARSAEHAIQIARERGVFCPIVEPTKEKTQ